MKLNFLAIVSKIINTFLVIKLLSFLLNPVELSTYLVSFNAIAILQFIFTIGLVSGVLAEATKKDNIKDLFNISFLSLLLLTLFLVIGSAIFDIKAIVILAAFFISIKSLTLAYTNGIGEKKKFIIICNIDSIILIFALCILSSSFGVIGVWFSYSIASFTSILTFFYLFKDKMINIKLMPSIEEYKNIYETYRSYIIMTSFSAFIVPIIYYLTRNIIFDTQIISEMDKSALLSGWRIYDSLIVLVGVFSNIVILSNIKDKYENNNYLLKYAIIVSIMIAFGILIISHWSNLFSSVFLTRDYIQYNTLFVFIMCAFLLRAFSYIIGLKFLLNKKAKYFIIIELSHSISFLFLIFFSSFISAEFMALSFIAQAFICLSVTIYYYYHD